jgi:hypothetical protein
MDVGGAMLHAVGEQSVELRLQHGELRVSRPLKDGISEAEL